MNQGTGKHTHAVKPRKPGRVIKRTVLTALLLTLAAVAALAYLARSQPDYWKQHQRFLAETSPQQLQQLAEQVRDKLNALANLGLEPAISSHPDILTAKPEDARINTEKTVTLSNPQIAGFIAEHLDNWMQQRGYVKPPEINDPMAAVDDGNLVMAFQLNAGGFSQVISGRFDLHLRDDGWAELTLDRFLVGKLPVPADTLSRFLRDHTRDPSAERAGRWLEKLQHVEFKPVVELDHRRRARLIDYQTLDDAIELTVRVQDHKTYKATNTALAGVPVD